MNLFHQKYPSIPCLNKDTGGGTGGNNSSETEIAGEDKTTTKAFITFPSEASFMERLKREGRAQVNEFLKELGFEKPDDLKNLIKKQKETEEASKTDYEKAQTQLQTLQDENKRVKLEAETTLKQAALLVQATAAKVKPERMNAFLKLVDLSTVTVTNGAVDEITAKAAVENLLKEFPEFIGQSGNNDIGGEDFSGGGGGRDLGSLSMIDYIKARQKNS